MSDDVRPITVRDVQAAMSLEGRAHDVAREHLARTLGVTDRELEMLVAESRVLDTSAHAYLAEYDLDRSHEPPSGTGS
jgi:hypothetical protein